MNPPEDDIIINPNTADLESLTRVPGIGPALAKLIIAARPFATLDDLGKVSGVGPQSIQVLLPYLTLDDDLTPGSLPEAEDQPGPESVLVTGDEPLEAAETAPAAGTENKPEIPDIIDAGLDEEVATPEPAEIAPDQAVKPTIEEPAYRASPTGARDGAAEIPAAPAPPTENRVAIESVTRADLVRLVLISSLLTMLLTVFVILTILFSINRGSLQFALPRDVRQLSQQADELDRKLSVLGNDQEALRTRLDNLESMAGRMKELEILSAETRSLVDSNVTQVQDLTTQANTLTQRVDSINGQVEKINSQVNSLQSSSDRFQQFLDGLAALLTNLAPKDK
jgi:prefoldin subunit 5